MKTFVVQHSPGQDGATRVTPLSDDCGSDSGAGRPKLVVVSQLVQGAFRAAFLPSNPVRAEYYEFQLFDSLQALCSYLKVQAQTRLVLESLGVGSSAASAVAGATLWTVKDGASHVSGLFFGASYATRWPQYPESFRLLADLSNDAASLLDCALPFLPGLRARVCVTLLCTVLRSLCGVCAGAVRPVILSHLALSERGVADLQAKEGSQETLVTLLGLALGLLLTPDSGEAATAAWIFALTLAHAYLNWRAVKALKFRDLTVQRLALAMEGWDGGEGEVKEFAGGAGWEAWRVRVGVSLERMKARPSGPRDKYVIERTKDWLGREHVRAALSETATEDDVVECAARCLGFEEVKGLAKDLKRKGWKVGLRFTR